MHHAHFSNIVQVFNLFEMHFYRFCVKITKKEEKNKCKEKFYSERLVDKINSSLIL